YELYALHGYKRADIIKFQEDLQKISPGAEVELYHQMNQVFIKYDGMEESPLISDFIQLMPENDREKFVGTAPSIEKQLLLNINADDFEPIVGSMGTTLYTVDNLDDIYDKIIDAVTVGTLDEKEFLDGDSVILAIPMYRQETAREYEAMDVKIPDSVEDYQMFEYILGGFGGYEFSYDGNLEAYYEKDTSIEPGESLILYKWYEQFGSAYSGVAYSWIDAKVGGVIYYTKDSALYPFLAEKRGISIIGSDIFMKKISGNVFYNPVKVGEDFNGGEEQFAYILSQCPTIYGETHLNIYTSDGANAVENAAQIAKIGKQYGFTFVNYNEENWNIYYRALNNALILGILGGTSLLIALMILWNIHMSAFEQERKRIGVLQALGVTNRKIAWMYWKDGVRNAAGSLLISHIILFGIIYLVQDGILYLKYYPWMAHIGICILYFLLSVFVYCGPIRELKKYAPTENISA
ncbi:MAG: ABC transporter permease, partial [Roseburia sp.]|nr:ABC transporter permease [Roseburia sp.]